MKKSWALLLILPVLLSGCGGQKAVNASLSSAVSSAQVSSSSQAVQSQNTSSAVSDDFQDYKDDLQKTKSINLYMMNPREGFRTGDKAIYKTKDGGKTWAVISRPLLKANSTGFDAEFIDKQHIFVAVDYPVQTEKGDSETAKLYYTKDGGAAWSQGKFPENAVSKFNFCDPKHGFVMIGGDAAAGTSYYMGYQTSDSGTSWRMLGERFRFCGVGGPLIFTDRNHGYFFSTGSGACSYDFKFTHDGGKTWGSDSWGNSLPTFGEDDYTSSLRPVLFNAKTKVVLYTAKYRETENTKSMRAKLKGSGDFYNLLFTSNAGCKFTGKKAEFFSDLPLNEKTVSFYGADHGYSIIKDGGEYDLCKFQKSGGFQKVSHTFWMKDAVKVQFLNDKNGFVLTADALYATENGGHVWNQYPF